MSRKYIVEIRDNYENTLEVYRFDDTKDAESFAQLVYVDPDYENILVRVEDNGLDENQLF